MALHDPSFPMFAARSGLAAIARHEEAIAQEDRGAGNASLAEVLFWWRALDEVGVVGRLPDQGLRLALTEARNAATHRVVAVGLHHAAYPGMVMLGLTAPGQGWTQVWVGQLPDNPRLTEAKREAARIAHREHLAYRDTRLAVEQLRELLSRVVDGSPMAAPRNSDGD